jgi:hypothetical protein
VQLLRSSHQFWTGPLQQQLQHLLTGQQVVEQLAPRLLAQHTLTSTAFPTTAATPTASTSSSSSKGSVQPWTIITTSSTSSSC